MTLCKPALATVVRLDEVKQRVNQRAKDAALQPARLLLTPCACTDGFASHAVAQREDDKADVIQRDQKDQKSIFHGHKKSVTMDAFGGLDGFFRIQTLEIGRCRSCVFPFGLV